MTSAPVDISIVAACLNEAENVIPRAAALQAVLEEARVTYEIIYIDNGSTDGTIDLVKEMCARDPRIKLIVNNRNFGYMRSPAHAIYQASGRAVVGMCSDFQDPPALIGDFIARWRSGAKIVLGVRQSEKSSFIIGLVRAIGYGFYNRFGDYPVIPGATGFGLYDRDVVDCLRQWRDPEPFFRGMLVESGYRLETIHYHRPPRAAGETKNKFASLVNFALITVGSASKKLLRAPLIMSVFAFMLTGLLLMLGLVRGLLGQPSAGLMYLSAASLAFSVILFFLGLIGEQVRIISDMVRNVPLVTERERVNFD